MATTLENCDGACFPPKNCHNHLALPEDFCVCRNFILSPSRCSLSTQSHTVDQDEVSKFRAMCGDWWKPDGSFAALHTYNELRIPLIRDGILQQVSTKEQTMEKTINRTPLPLSGKTILDVGCGGGILSEPLCRIGATVTGIDAVSESIKIAEIHKRADPELKERLSYRNTLVEDLEEHESYDAVVASEIVEHVSDLDTFLTCCCSLVKPGGSLFVTTLNKTAVSYLSAIVAAEYILNINDPGTHDWEKFVRPETLQSILRKNGLRTHLLHGTSLNPCNLRWSWTRNVDVTYALHAIKPQKRDES